MSDSVTPWPAACQASLSSTISRSLLKLMSIGSVMQSNWLILCRPLLLLLSIFPSISIFSNDKCVHPCNPHPNQDRGHFPPPVPSVPFTVPLFPTGNCRSDFRHYRSSLLFQNSILVESHSTPLLCLASFSTMFLKVTHVVCINSCVY